MLLGGESADFADDEAFLLEEVLGVAGENSLARGFSRLLLLLLLLPMACGSREVDMM